MTTKDLDAFFEAGWNAHDVDRLMTFMADDCVFESVAGPEACGTRHVGRERVRAAFARVFAAFPGADGRGVEVNGCDVFTFREGKIAVKSSFFKTRTPS